jgi:Ogr/Delta-like zinc finger
MGHGAFILGVDVMTAGLGKGKHHPCPNCSSKSKVVRSTKIASGTIDLYLQCQNDDCRFRWRAQVQPIAIVTPPETVINPQLNEVFPIGGRNSQTEKHPPPAPTPPEPPPQGPTALEPAL